MSKYPYISACTYVLTHDNSTHMHICVSAGKNSTLFLAPQTARQEECRHPSLFDSGHGEGTSPRHPIKGHPGKLQAQPHSPHVITNTTPRTTAGLRGRGAAQHPIPLRCSRRREERRPLAALQGAARLCQHNSRAEESEASAARGRREAAAGTEQQMLFSPSSFKPPMLGNYCSLATALSAGAGCVCVRARVCACVCVCECVCACPAHTHA